MKLAIIEDEQVHMELLAGYLEAWSADREVTLNIIPFASAEAFLFSWEEERDFDAIFVDIQMGQMNGMEMARRVRQKDEDIAIVFTTGITDYLAEGYEVEALYYLLKPVSREKLFMCMDKVLHRGVREHFVLVQTKEETVKLPVERIMYVEARGHGCVVELCSRTGETWQTECQENISQMAQLLEGEDFVRCHRSYLCRVGSIHHIDRTEVVCDNGSRIPISRRLYGEVNQAFIRHFRKAQG